MPLKNRLLAWAMKRRGRYTSPTKVIAITFALLILLGAYLLTLPIASRNGQRCDFLRALFTATSTTCVTGLTPFDPYTQWTGFGQAVMLCLIEIGGLGFMSMATLLIFILRKRIGLKQRMVMAQALSLNDMDGVVRLQKTVIFGSLSVQFLGALILTLYFTPKFGFAHSLWLGVFHSVSAFCNAGFDVFGFLEPGVSVARFQSDPVVLLTLGALVIIGGLGFLVWEELASGKRFSQMSVYSRLVLLTTGALLLAGWIAICLLEWNNPQTLGEMSIGDKLLNGLFQSISLRTAGFAAVDQAGLTEGGKAVSMVIMLIGGSSGSTAGGLKTVTFVVLVLFVWARLRGRATVTVFKRTIPDSQVLDAMVLAMTMVILSVFGAVFVCATSPVSFVNALYEVVSALATVGLTAGTTLSLSVPAQILIILYMYFGRVGILTISLGFLTGNQAVERFRYAQTNLLIG